MTRATILFATLFFVACDATDGEYAVSIETEFTSNLDVEFPEIDTALPDYDSDSDSDSDTDTDTTAPAAR